MKCVVKYFQQEHPPLLQLSIYDAPHRRMHVATIQRYRDELKEACAKAGIAIPISEPLDLSVIFISPSSPDLDNLLTALYQALDGATLKGGGILTDDGLISKATVSKFYPGPPKK